MFGRSGRAFSSFRFCSFPYVLIGGGTASYYAALTIRARDPEAKVLIVSEENETPYNRQMLSKEVWWYGNESTPKNLSYVAASGKRREVHYEADGFYPKLEDLADASTSSDYQHGGIALIRNSKAVKVDSKKNYVELADGKRIEFEKCLIATGSRPKYDLNRNNSGDSRLEKSISVFGNIEDYKRLENVIRSKKESRIAIVGGGFLGTELAYSLSRRYGLPKEKDSSRVELVHLFPEAGLLTGVLPPMLCDYATNRMRARGIRVLPNHKVVSASILGNGQVELGLESTDEKRSNSRDDDDAPEEETIDRLTCDHVVVVSDSEPSVEIARASGLPLDMVNGGILADSRMRVKDNIWAAGDVCSFEDPIIGRRRRVQHLEHAQITGRVAGENMTGGNKLFSHQGAFVSMFGLGDHISAVGDVDANLDTISFFIESAEEDEKSEDADLPMKAVIFYTVQGTDRKKKRIVGVLLFNIFEGMDLEIARKIIADKREFNNQKAFADLVRLFDQPPPEEPEANEENKGKLNEIGSRV